MSDPWMYHMRRGEFEKAWQISDAALAARAGIPCWHLPRHLQYIWNGQPLDGRRVLVRCYHGLGDTIQFIRYAPMVAARAAELVVWAQEPLLPLLRLVDGIDRLLPLHDGQPGEKYDIDVEIMELPHIFRTTLQTIPAIIPYLHITPVFPYPRGSKMTVGLVWKSGDWDDRRSVPFQRLKPLFEIAGIQFIILQAGAVSAGWEEGYGNYPGEFTLQEFAALLRGLDLLLTVDSMPAHLGGALGVPVWALLHADADWRWMEGREDSPWYPGMRLFRQKVAGNWEGVVERVVTALKEELPVDGARPTT
jgi:hypothetical protein